MRTATNDQHDAAWNAEVERYRSIMREHRGGQAAVGRYLGVDRQTFWRWLRRGSAMPPFAAVALDRLFNHGAADWAHVEHAINPLELVDQVEPMQLHELTAGVIVVGSYQPIGPERERERAA